MGFKKFGWPELIGAILILIVAAYTFMLLQQEMARESQYSCMQIFNLNNTTINNPLNDSTYLRCCNIHNQSDCFVQPTGLIS